MSLLDDLKQRADQDGDGRLSKEDLDSLKDGNNDSLLDQLKDKADQNDDGKLNREDLHGLNDSLGGIKEKLF